MRAKSGKGNKGIWIGFELHVGETQLTAWTCGAILSQATNLLTSIFSAADLSASQQLNLDCTPEIMSEKNELDPWSNCVSLTPANELS